MKYTRTLLLAATLLASVFAHAATPKYIFYFIGDGMGWGAVNAAQYYNRIQLGNTSPLLMMQFPVVGSAFTYSASSPVTDSAAAGTALSTGSKTTNYMVGVSPDTIPYTSIAADLKKAGYGVAVLTSVTADDATPAAFYAHQPNRSMRPQIAAEAAASGYDFFGGVEFSGIRPDNDNLDRFTSAGYTLISDYSDPKAATAQKIVLTRPNGRSHIGYTLDSVPGALNLTDMTRMALAHLQRVSPKKFFMMVEGGNIDHTIHANDGATSIREILAFQDAIRVAYDFYLAHPKETLIIVTADHDTSGMALNGSVDFTVAARQRISKDGMADYFRSLIKKGEPMSWEQMKDFLTDKLGFWTDVKISDKDTDALHRAFDKTFVARQSQDEKGLYNTFNEFVTEVFRIQNRKIGTHFTTQSHTANPVPVFAIGAGAEKFGHMLNNTDIPRTILPRR